jgi:hypothetical protein
MSWLMPALALLLVRTIVNRAVRDPIRADPSDRCSRSRKLDEELP